MAGWGDGTWSDGGWGGVVADPISGSFASGSTGTLRTGRAKNITGAAASGSAGTLRAKISVSLTGSGATGASNSFGYAYWTKIDTSQTPNWTPIISI